MAADKKAVKKPEAGHMFTVEKDGKKTVYKTLLAVVILPGVNDGQAITSLEISHSEEAQAYLVENSCLGSVIEVVA